MAERTFVAEHVVNATPWDVYAVLTDESQQAQWRDRFERHAPVAEETPYTRIVFEDELVIDLEPSGSGTLVRGTRKTHGEGPFGAVGLWLRGRRGAESEIEDQLKRIGATAENPGI